MIEQVVNQFITLFSWRLFFVKKRRHECRSFSLRIRVCFGQLTATKKPVNV